MILPSLPPKKRHWNKRRSLWLVLILLVAGGYVGLAVGRPLATLMPSLENNQLRIATQAASLPWPAYGQGAFGTVDGQILATHGDQTPIATASLAKLITALTVLNKYPIANDNQGPTITLGASDVTLYHQYIAAGGSVVAVANGEQLSERQLLEGMLLPSGNNAADSLATWAFGSLSAYHTAATQFLQAHGLNNTTVGTDASGLSDTTTSTASDMVKLGGLIMQNAVLAQIVSEKTAVIPVAGTIRNVNWLLGQNGIIGIKTGNNDQDKGVFLGATTATIPGSQQTITLITALAGANSLQQVLNDSNGLLAAARTTVINTTVVHKGAVLGTYQTADGRSLQAVAAADLSTVLLRGTTASATVSLDPIKYTAQVGQTVGRVRIPTNHFSQSASVNIVLEQAPTKPTTKWLLLHPLRLFK